MGLPRYVPRPKYDLPTTPFLDAEEAWFWFSRCQRARVELARFGDAVPTETRPCDPDDIYRAAIGLLHAGRITRHHLRVLATFGLEERPPDPRCREEEAAARLWDEALDRLTTPLRARGIVR